MVQVVAQSGDHQSQDLHVAQVVLRTGEETNICCCGHTKQKPGGCLHRAAAALHTVGAKDDDEDLYTHTHTQGTTLRDAVDGWMH